MHLDLADEPAHTSFRINEVPTEAREAHKAMYVCVVQMSNGKSAFNIGLAASCAAPLNTQPSHVAFEQAHLTTTALSNRPLHMVACLSTAVAALLTNHTSSKVSCRATPCVYSSTYCQQSTQPSNIQVSDVTFARRLYCLLPVFPAQPLPRNQP